MGDLVAPLVASDFVTAFRWVHNPRWPNETEPLLEQSSLPVEPGRVCCIYAEPLVLVYDLAWGAFGEPGSVRATFRHPFVPCAMKTANKRKNSRKP